MKGSPEAGILLVSTVALLFCGPGSGVFEHLRGHFCMERIRQLRNEKGLSQVKLAVRADMDPATLNRLEQGKGNPNLKTLERVAEALGVEVADFFPKVQQPLPEEGGERREHDHRFDSDGEKGVTLEQLHELGIKSNNDDVVVLKRLV